MRSGYRKVVAALGMEPALPDRVRLMLWVLAFSAIGVGVQAEFFPRSFYDDFPLGRGWVAMDGRYNEHLIRDVGALNLALLVLTIGAIVVGTRAIAAHHGVVVAGVLGAASRVPPAPSHDEHAGERQVGIVVSLSIPVIAALVVLFDRSRGPGRVLDLRDAAPAESLTPMSVRR